MSTVDPADTGLSQASRAQGASRGGTHLLNVDFEIAFKRRMALFFLEITILLLSCTSIVALWENREPPPMSFAVLVAFVLFASNAVCGTFNRVVYLNHLSRLGRSALAHVVGGVIVAVPVVVWFNANSELVFLLGMLAMAYFTSNTLRPVLVEVLRAGNKLEQRRKPSEVSA